MKNSCPTMLELEDMELRLLEAIWSLESAVEQCSKRLEIVERLLTAESLKNKSDYEHKLKDATTKTINPANP